MIFNNDFHVQENTTSIKTRCVKATQMAPSQKVEKSAISITHVDTNLMVVSLSHIKNQLKIWRCIENKSV